MPRHNPPTALIRLALTGVPVALVPKSINLPTIPADNTEPEPDWHTQLRTFCGQDSAHEWITLYQSVQTHRIEYWERTARAFEANPGSFYNAWHYLDSHPVFWKFRGDGDMPHPQRIHERHLMHDQRLMDSVTIDVVKVNPATNSYDDNEELNTKTQVWIEMGKWGWPGTDTGDPQGRDAHWHDTELDCGADDFQSAIITAAIYLHAAMGNDRSACDDKDPA
jgi:hypothetical protein